MNINIENDFQKRVMYQSFVGPTELATKADVMAWRATWTAGLKSWHSPYKVVVDCTTISRSPFAAVLPRTPVILT